MDQTMVLATIVAITCVFGLGMTMALLGAVKIRLTEHLGINDAQMGRLFSVYMFSNLIFVLIAGVLSDVIGFKGVAIAGYILGALAVFLFGKANNYKTAILGCILLGVGGMFINTVGNTMLVNPVILFEDATMSNNFGNVFFGIGAFIVPILTAWLFNKMGYAPTYLVLGVIILIPVIFAILGQFPEAEAGISASAAMQLITQRQIILGALALMCYIALEVSMGGWVTTYMTHVGADEAKAARVLSFFWISIMAGRLIAALVIGPILTGMDTSLDLIGAWFVFALALIAALVLFSMKTINSTGGGTLAVILSGLVFGPIFPTIVGTTLIRTATDIRGSAFGLIFAVGLIGAIFLPAWMGKISSGEGKTIKNSMAVAAGTAVVLVVISVIMGFALPEPVV